MKQGEQITVFGAGGKVGSLVVEEALRRGYRVVAFVHSRDLFTPSPLLAVVKGDVYNASDVAKALHGSSVVVSCLGSWGTPAKNVLTAAMQAIVPAMQSQNIRRIVTLTGSGALAPSVPETAMHRLMLRALAPFPAGKVFKDGEEHMRLLAASGLDWTTLRSPVMTNFGKPTYLLSGTASSALATINRTAVASALLDQLDAIDHVQQAPIIHRAKHSSIGHLPKV